MRQVKLAHPIGHKLKFNGKHIAIGGEWHDLWGGNFNGFEVYQSRYYWIDNKYTTYGNNIETDIESSSSSYPGIKRWGWLKIYNRISIPDSRVNDKFVILEIPFNPYRETRSRSMLQNNMDESYFKVGLIRRFRHDGSPALEDSNPNYNENFSFDITSTPTSIIEKGDDGEEMHYGVGSWTHTLSIPNVSYTNTFTTVPGPSYKIRLLCDLSTKKTYFKIDSTFPDNVVLTDYIDTGFTMPYDETEYYNFPYSYIINVYAGGAGIKAPTEYPLEYLIAGYHVGSGTPITLKSYFGTL